MRSGVPCGPDAAPVVHGHDVRRTAHILAKADFSCGKVERKELERRVGYAINDSARFVCGDGLDVVLRHGKAAKIVFSRGVVVMKSAASIAFRALVFAMKTGSRSLKVPAGIQLE